VTPAIQAAADHLSGNGQGNGKRDHLPAYIVGDPQADDKWHGEMNVDKPAQRILGRSHPQVAQGDIAEQGEEQQTDDGNTKVDVQEDGLSEVFLSASLCFAFNVSQWFEKRSKKWEVESATNLDRLQEAPDSSP
jgi:hypothetical protein